MLTVGFIIPSSDYLEDPFRGDPLTQFYLLTILEQHYNNRLKLHLVDLRGIKRRFAIHHIPECDIYLYSTYTLDINEQTNIVTQVRSCYPKSTHVAGGPHVGEFQKESLQIFDSIIIGEGEQCLISFFEDYMNNQSKQVYKQSSSIDINDYPFSRRHFLPITSTARKNMMTIKKKPEYKELLGTTVVFSRGCPYNCIYCSMPRLKEFNRDTRFRKPDLVTDEIKYLKQEYGIQGINILDENCVPHSPLEAKNHFNAIKNADILWRGQTRVNAVNDEIAKMAKESGCVAMGLGVESVSQNALNLINKSIHVQESRDAIRILKQHQIETRIYLIIGLPGEPTDIVDRTIQFIEETQPELVYLSLFTVRPGTIVYNSPERYGIKWINRDWDKTMHLFGRYELEEPKLTFEYENPAPWGKAFSNQEIIQNQLFLQEYLRKHNMSHI